MTYIILNEEGSVLDVVKTLPQKGIVQKLTAEEVQRIALSPQGHIDFSYHEGQLVYTQVAPTQAQLQKVAELKREHDLESAVGIESLHSSALAHELGFFGNIWLVKLFFKKAGDVHAGHSHEHDHISLLLSGSVEVKLEGHKPQIFEAPTYVTIKAHLKHEIIALEDNTLWWCIHARRNDDGEVVEIYSAENDPLGEGN